LARSSYCEKIVSRDDQHQSNKGGWGPNKNEIEH
jgi:hypothetical protein